MDGSCRQNYDNNFHRHIPKGRMSHHAALFVCIFCIIILCMKIADIIYESVVDGPGIRSVIFFQGCDHHCPMCHNPETWDFDNGKDVSILSLFYTIHNKIGHLTKNITFSGGDPLYQIDELSILAEIFKQHGYHVCTYTGFTWEELIDKPVYSEFLKYIDLLIDGPFIYKERSLDIKFRGSMNQRIIDVQESLHTGQIVLSPLNA